MTEIPTGVEAAMLILETRLRELERWRPELKPENDKDITKARAYAAEAVDVNAIRRVQEQYDQEHAECIEIHKDLEAAEDAIRRVVAALAEGLELLNPILRTNDEVFHVVYGKLKPLLREALTAIASKHPGSEQT